jgi:hypothetical protein
LRERIGWGSDAMATTAYDLRARLKTLATGLLYDGVALAEDRISIGYVALDVANKFLADLETASPYMVIRPASLLARRVGEMAEYQVDVDIWFTLAKAANNTFEKIETFLCNLAAIWVGFEVSWESPQIDVQKDAGVIHYALRVIGTGCG